MEKLLFKEEQRFTQWWMWLLLIFALLAIIVPVVNAISKDMADNDSLNSRLILYGVVAVIFLLAVIIVTLFIRLKTKITYDGICFAYFPFRRKWEKISKKDIKRYEVRKYRANREFGGYGMKNKRKSGRAFTISGNTGLQLYFKDGKKLLIGTQKKQAIKHAMDKLCADMELSPKPEKVVVTKSDPWLTGKAKKVLIILALELALAIIIFGLIQLFNLF